MKREMFLMTVFSVIGLVLLLVFTPVTSLTQEEKSGTQESSKVCSACHADQVKAFELNRHFVLDSKGFAKKAGADFSCASCHGDTADHLKQPGKGTIFAFDAEDPAGVKTQRCQTCHDDTHPRFSLSPHAKAGLDCTSCHSVHADSDSKKDSLVLTERVSGTCYTCHSDTFAKFNLNERHRLKEGILECTSCHDPHEPSTRLRLAGFKDATCVDCHTDKQGPFVFEHGSILVEDCASCHEPHGSVNRHMLTFQKVANLCYSCHAVVPSFHSRFTAEDNCANCHSTIHGSNLSPVFLE